MQKILYLHSAEMLVESIPTLRVFTLAGSLILYHALDFSLHNRHHPQPISFAACLCSMEYVAAFAFALTEYYLEYFFCSWKRSKPLITICYVVGLIGMVLGDGLRKLAMMQNGIGFTHKIATTREKDHQLVVSGVYRLTRHPGYLGWFIWAVSTQVMLANPLSIIVYIFVSWKFFSDRIRYEEETLLALFGDEYLEYMKRTRCYIPSVSRHAATAH
ncbi:Protein-S isoprenylcysteine O-methyltransferase [Giardia duodenalis]|uniref:Protein-S-isoprenylcysteine O-methyltransferase n=1 Tax=Giardia intestinalis TaxID=5741 RepID=V6TCT7_GIAIN|nr:Protein-S isoprenylcysteine O-methyltransferase [Giardia intestinalis]